MNCNQNTKALIYNDYLSFLLYQEGQNLARIAIACPELSPCLWSYHKNILGVNSPPLDSIVVNLKCEIPRSKTSLENSPPPEGCPQGGVDKPIFTHINNTPIKRNFVENLPHNPALNQLARDKRKAGILSEVLFWQQVHQKKFYGIDVDRQRIIGNYIVDFYIKTLGLVIEIDGCSHDEKVEYDAKRQRYLESCGLRVYRIEDYDVKHNLDKVMLELERYIVSEYGESTPDCGCSWEDKEFSVIEILDYLYAVLHIPAYLERFKVSLEINSSRIPFPVDAKTFWHLVAFGREIRAINFFENPRIESYVLQYPFRGDSIVDTIISALDANEETQTGLTDTPLQQSTVSHPKSEISRSQTVLTNSPPQQSTVSYSKSEISRSQTVLTNSPPQQSAVLHPKSEISRSQIGLINSPPLEGCPQGGVVNSKSLDYPEDCSNKNISLSDSRYSSNIPEFPHNLYIAGTQLSRKWLKDHDSSSLNIRISTLQYTPKTNQ